MTIYHYILANPQNWEQDDFAYQPAIIGSKIQFMMDNSRERNLEYGLYALAFGLALALRLLRLGELPLGDDEARWALQALDLAKGLQPAMGPQPAYVMLTGLVFFIVQASNFAARLVPALFGAALSLTPFNFRDRLGSQPALVLAFFLAFDPGFLALSRLAGSPVLAVGALLFAWGTWRNGNLRAAGIWAGIALLGGPLLWPGLLSLGLAYGLCRGFFFAQPQAAPIMPVVAASAAPIPLPSDRKTWLTLAAYAAGTYILLGSFFLLARDAGGLSAGLASIPAYFGGWLGFTNVPASRLLIGLASYELFAILLAIVGLVRGILKRDGLIITLGLWLLASLVLALAYPSRQVADLAWVLIPLLALASVETLHAMSLVPIRDGNWETIGMAVFTSAILVFAVLNYSAIALVPMDQAAVQLHWWILLGSLGLLAVSIAMVAFGWSFSTAIQGGIWGTLLVLAFYTLSTAMASGGLRTYHTLEMWPTGPYAAEGVKTLVSQMNDLSRWKTGVNASLDVTIAGVDSPTLLWTLRDWPLTVLPDANLPSGITPSMLIASDQFSNTDIQSTYRGQDLSWRTSPLWDQGLLTDWLRWSILHEFPKNDEKLILWVRSDIFIDSQNGQ